MSWGELVPIHARASRLARPAQRLRSRPGSHRCRPRCHILLSLPLRGPPRPSPGFIRCFSRCLDQCIRPREHRPVKIALLSPGFPSRFRPRRCRNRCRRQLSTVFLSMVCLSMVFLSRRCHSRRCHSRRCLSHRCPMACLPRPCSLDGPRNRVRPYRPDFVPVPYFCLNRKSRIQA